MEKVYDSSVSRVTVTYSSAIGADTILREIQNNGGAVYAEADTVTIIETRRVRFEKFPRPVKEVDKVGR